MSQILISDDLQIKWRREFTWMWEIDLKRELRQIADSISLQEGDDHVCWIPGQGTYTVKKGNQVFSSHSSLIGPWTSIWNIKVPPKIKILL